MAGEDVKHANVNRRTFLASSAAGAAVVTVAPSVIASTATGNRFVGRSLADGWLVAELEGGLAGAVKFVLSHPEQDTTLHVLVCGHQSGSDALASTGVVDLFLMNDGRDGAVRTPASAVKVVKSLADLLRGSERKLPGFSQLLSQKERLVRFDPIDHADPLASRRPPVR